MAHNVNRNTPVHKVALRNFMLLTLACHSEEESKYLHVCQNHTKKTWIFQAPEAPAPGNLSSIVVSDFLPPLVITSLLEQAPD